MQNSFSAEALKEAGLNKVEISLDAPKSATSAAASKQDKDIKAGTAADGKKAEKKEKKEKKEPKPAPDAAVPIVPSMIDLRVGIIRSAKKHPNADALYVEEIDCGEEAPRTVVSGLVRYIPIEEMQDRACITVCNLKPAVMRGIKSFAMVLCATSPDGANVGASRATQGKQAW